MGRTKPTVAKEYVVGLTDGEGCFHVNIWKSSSYRAGYGIQVHFYIKMQEKDRPLLEKVKNTLDCGAVYFQKEARKNHCQCYRYTVNSHRDILDKIIPFFLENSLQSITKQRSFKSFCKVAELIERGEHLTEKGIKKIRILKATMNQKTVGFA